MAVRSAALAATLAVGIVLPSGASAVTLPPVLEPQTATPATAQSPTAQSSPSSPPAAVTINPILADAGNAGQWNVLPYTTPGASIHATVLNDGRVLIVSGSGNNPAQFASGTFNIWTWDPGAGTFELTPRLPYDLFCGGHALLPDGKVLFVGGTAGYPTASRPYFLGTRTSYVFDPATGAFDRAPDMTYARWYASAVEQGDGSVLAVSGLDDSSGNVSATPERFDPGARSWTALSTPFFFPPYPALTLLADGRMFYAGAAASGSNFQSPGVWTPTSGAFTGAQAPADANRRDQSSALLLPPAQQQRVAVFGGGIVGSTSISAVADADLYDLSNASAPAHSIGPPMVVPKMHVLGVILPDETVFETGGGQSYASRPVMEASIYHPVGGWWQQMNPPQVPRTYHAEAILLPDGRVATLGSDTSGYAQEMRIEVFSPPYIFKPGRPAITGAPSEARYGASFTVGVGLAAGASLSKLVLVKPASVTHSIDPNQRLVEVPFLGLAGAYVATVPWNRNLTPPGWYMMFAVDSQGRPSVAHWVHVS